MSKRLLPLRQLGKSFFSVGCLIAAVYAVWLLWQAYENTPWTRDAKVVAQVVRIAPEVSGTIEAITVADNQLVNQGDELYRLEQSRFQFAVNEAQANLAIAQQQSQQKSADAKRRASIKHMLSQEEVQQSARDASIAQSAVQKATIALSIAKLDLEKSIIRAPVTGYITHLRIQKGDYATAGKANLSLVNTDSFIVMGYFEETKLSQIHVNAPVNIRLMAYSTPLTGHIESIGYGITDENQQLDEFGLPHVNPSFSWIRLAQRVPVRIVFDQLPSDIHLTAGLTASVEVETEQDIHSSLIARLYKIL